METCTFEVGLLQKKPCGQPSVTKCANCEMPLCSKHAQPQVQAGGRKTGKFMCKECLRAWNEYGRDAAAAPAVKKPAEGEAKPAAAAPKPAAAAPAAKAAAPAAKPAAPAAAAPAAKKEEEKKKDDDDAPLEFTPSKK